MNNGSNTKFRILVKIIIIVGVLEFPSAWKVSENKLAKMNTNEPINIGIKYSLIKSVDWVIFINSNISNKNSTKHAIPIETIILKIIPWINELYESS